MYVLYENINLQSGQYYYLKVVSNAHRKNVQITISASAVIAMSDTESSASVDNREAIPADTTVRSIGMLGKNTDKIIHVQVALLTFGSHDGR